MKFNETVFVYIFKSCQEVTELSDWEVEQGGSGPREATVPR